MYKIKVPADSYHSRVKEIKEEYKDFGLSMPEVEAVDMNGKFVPMDKSKADSNLARSAECAKERLGKGGY